MKRKGISLLLLVVLCSMTLAAKSYFAIREDGKKIILNDMNMTWSLAEKDSGDMSVLVVPSEPTLYSYALREGWEMCEFYLECYEGVDIENTIDILFEYHFDSPSYIHVNYTEKIGKLQRECLIKGIQYTYNYGVIKTVGKGLFDISSLYFFWEYAELLEREDDYKGALYWYQELEKLYIAKNKKCNYSFLNNSLEEIQSKIFAIQLKLSKSN